MTVGQMTRAQVTVWNVYMDRLQALVKDQHDRFACGDSVASLTFLPPSRTQTAIIQRALDDEAKEARLAVLSDVFGPIIDALDSLDSSRSKSETVKACHVELQAVYDTLHALKKRYEEPASVDAVDPHDGTTPA